MFRPTNTDMEDKHYGYCYDIDLIRIQYSMVVAFGRHHKRGVEASGCATPFVVFFVLAMNKVSIVAVTTILVLHIGNGQSEHVFGHHVPRY